MLFKNETKKSVMVRLDDKKDNTGYRWKTVKPDKEIDLRKDIGENCGFTSVEDKPDDPKGKGIEDKKDKDGKYSKTDLIDATKKEQIKILKDLRVNDKDIEKLKTEEKRVAKILKLQNAKDNK